MTLMRTFQPVLLLAAAALLHGCAMQNPQEDPVVLKLNEIERRLSAVERILANGSLVDMAMQVDNLQRTTAELQGSVETLEYQAEDTADRQRDLYQDLDQRIQQLEQRLEAASGGSLAPGQLPVPGGSDRDNYQAAFALLKMGYCNYELERWDAARDALQRVQREFPETTAARLADQRLDRMREEGA